MGHIMAKNLYTCMCFLLVLMSQIYYVGSQGLCYSLSQRNCETEWNRLISAEIDSDHSSICRYFGGFHKCITKFKSRCQFAQAGQKLYEVDIVAVYTKKPYSCHMVGGNMQMKGEYDTNRGETTTTTTTTLGSCWMFTSFAMIYRMYII